MSCHDAVLKQQAKQGEEGCRYGAAKRPELWCWVVEAGRGSSQAMVPWCRSVRLLAGGHMPTHRQGKP